MNTTQTRFGVKKFAIILLTLTSAFIHFSLLFPDPLFILNGLGYLAFLGAYFLPIQFAQQRHNLVRWAFVGYIVINLLAWLAIGDKSWPAGALGYATKLIEIVLMVLLLTDRSK